MPDKYPLFPTLSEEAQKEAVELVEDFKQKLEGVAKDAIRKLYTDIVPYIESDSWANFRNQLLAGFRNWGNKKIQGEYDFNEIRKGIFTQFRDDIMKEMPEELVAENESLKKEIEILKKMSRYYS